MRHLNKIIFINSANIPYAEVMLDGNVHFAGTQGVGKSTVLRALLFFYNADKMRLGIQAGQKSFEEFYFRYSNSYIVYEVKTEHGAYSILTGRSNGKVVFRFIDAPFRKEWLVDGDNRATSDWIKIRNCIGSNIDISSKIDTYEYYRNIIFGNTHDRSHRFDKYALVESSKYQNIPRSIQNVFLNSKLDADFVKTTIIQSMSETEDSLNLAAYRHLVSDFEREFNEIDCWYKKDGSGNIIVRTKAAKVVDTYRTLIALEFDMEKTWHRLNYQVNFTRGQLPIVEERIHSIQTALTRIEEKIENVQKEYSEEHDSLIGKIGEYRLRLSEICKRRKRYDEMDIKVIIDFVGQESQLRVDKTQKEEALSLLQEKFKDISEKYRAIYFAFEKEEKEFVLLLKEELQHLRDEISNERDKAMMLCETRKQNIESVHKEWMTNSDERMIALNDELNQTDKRVSSLQFWHPLSKEIEACNEEINDLKNQENYIKAQISIVESKLVGLSQKRVCEVEKVELEFKQKRKLIETEIERINSNLRDTEKILSHWDGSFYEWLVSNKPGWEENIGKIVDEANVLHATGLNPELQDGNSIFGVKIDLEAIPVHHRTLDEYRIQKNDLEKSLEEEQQRFSDLQMEYEKELKTLKKEYKVKIEEETQQKQKLQYQYDLIPQKCKDLKTKLRQLQELESKKINEEREKYTEAYHKAKTNIEREKVERSRQVEKHDKEIKDAEHEFDKAKKELDLRLKTFKQSQEDKAAAKKSEIDSRKKLAQQSEHDELQGKGADVNAIEVCRNAIARIEDSLAKIEEQKVTVIEYHKDEKELFSHESEYRDQKRWLEDKDAQLRKDSDDKHKRYEEDKSELIADLNANKRKFEEMELGLEQYEQLCKVENVIPESSFLDDKVEKNNISCQELVTQIRGIINNKRQKQEELKRVVNSFNSHFGTNNIFHFITPQYDEDYQKYAFNLKEFIEDDKIEIYRERGSDHYNEILNKLSREVGLLMNHSTEIKAIINEVNRDFRERNFAGVIRSIELRIEESSDRLMQILRSISEFTRENSLSIGKKNLFSDNDHDRVNVEIIELLKQFINQLQKEPSRTELTLSDTFRLQFRIQENDNNTGWVERISNIGSDGTDILVKAMVNIMLINVFKTKAARKHGDFIIHCMMDEIGKLHPSNVAGILQFANVRNIYLINSSPMSYNADIYKYNYLLTKDSKSQTHVKRLMTVNSL